MKLRTADILSLFGGPTRVARLFNPPLTKSAVSLWGDYVPELRARFLLDTYPGAAVCLVDEDGTTAFQRAGGIPAVRTPRRSSRNSAAKKAVRRGRVQKG